MKSLACSFWHLAEVLHIHLSFTAAQLTQMSAWLAGSPSEGVQKGDASDEAASDVSQSNSSSPQQQSIPDRREQYAQLVTGQQHDEAQSILSQVRFSEFGRCTHEEQALWQWHEISAIP